MTEQHKTIVITGASSGIGLACAKAALHAGHKVIATARKKDDIAMLKALGAVAVELELNDESNIKASARVISEHTNGSIDILFNNAGFGLQVAMEDSHWQAIQEQLSVNVVGPVTLTNQLLPQLKSGSRVIFNSSILGLITIPFRGPYCMSKYALEAAADAYRLELRSRNIKVQLIEPGPIEAQFRANAHAKILACLGQRNTRLDYSNHLARLSAEGPSKGSLPADACADIFMGMVAGKNNKPRYLVTRTAKLAAGFKRLLGSHFDVIAKNNPPVKVR